MRDTIKRIRANLTGIEIEISETKFPAVIDYDQCFNLLGNVKKEVVHLSIAIMKDKQGLGMKGK